MSCISIGIDPGKHGGIAVIADDNVTAYPYSDETLMSVLRHVSGLRAGGQTVRTCVEKVTAMRGWGAVATFSFGKSAGFIEGALRAFGISYQLVPPQTWKKEFSLNKEKGKSAEVCKKLFPGVNLLETPACKKPHDGMTEALLMAEYARRKL